MAEYIERKALMRRIKEIHCAECDSYHGVRCRACCVGDTLDYIESDAAADVAPVVHGRWEYTPQTFNTLGLIRCPFCKWWSFDKSIDGIYKYCPNCGAKMDGGDNDAAD